MTKRLYILIIATMLLSTSMQLDQAIDLLEDHLNDFSGNLRQSALRLVSICYLAQDDKESSEKYARLLLSINPYYTSVQDPIRFEDMIALLKSGRSSTVTTASSQAESINEAPVPVTLRHMCLV